VVAVSLASSLLSRAVLRAAPVGPLSTVSRYRWARLNPAMLDGGTHNSFRSICSLHKKIAEANRNVL